jgi:hypothetical protein
LHRGTLDQETNAERAVSTTIFFSWQADTPTKEGRNFIERALERAVGRIGDDASVEEAVRKIEIDQDTKGAPGSPPIVETIFRKIDKAAIFVPDLTFVAHRLDNRPTPNPNVLVEYGWALRSLTHVRVLPVMNIAFGKPTAETMPFDMAHLRFPIVYDCPSDATDDDRNRECKALAKQLEQRIREILKSDDFKASLSAEAQRPPFPRQQPKNGDARFRPHGEPLGIVELSFDEIKLSNGPAMWLRMMPEFHPGREWQVADLKKIATENGVAMPLCNGVGGYGYMRAHDGFGVYRSGTSRDITRDVVFLFTTGEIWTVDTDYLQAGEHANAIPFVEEDFKSALNAYSKLLTKLGITPPFAWIAGMENIKGRGRYVPARPGYAPLFTGARGKCLLESVVSEGYHSPGNSPARSLHPFFAKLFDSCGLERPTWLDAAE